MELESINQLLTILVIFEAVKMGILFFAAFIWLYFQEKNE